MKYNHRGNNERKIRRPLKNEFKPVRVKGLSVQVDDYRDFDAAMNKWCRKVQEDGKMDVVRSKRYFEKPTVTRRKRKELAKLKEKYRKINAETKSPYR